MYRLVPVVASPPAVAKLVSARSNSKRRATTVGHYVFLKGHNWWPPRWLQAHEYIHTLQYQADLAQFGDYIARALSSGDTGPRYYPIETIAYLWGGWINAYERWEQMPWAIWKPM